MKKECSYKTNAKEIKEYIKNHIRVNNDNNEETTYVIITNPSMGHEKYEGKKGKLIKTKEVGKYKFAGDEDKPVTKVKLFNVEFKDGAKAFFLSKEFDIVFNKKEIHSFIEKLNLISEILNEAETIDDIASIMKNIDKEKDIHREIKKFKQTLPMIPVGNGGYIDENISSVYFHVFDPVETHEDDFTADFYTNSNEDKLNYIFGNFFRTLDECKENKKKIKDVIDKAVEKQKDWAMINRIMFHSGYFEKNNHGDYEITPSSSAAIFCSKFAEKIHDDTRIEYYKLTTDHFQTYFYIKKVVVYNHKDTIDEHHKACFDYATGNFFLTHKEAKNSMMFKKMKTFFKYRPEKDTK